MDVIFDIDGTLANAEHRLHLINDTAFWVSTDGKPAKPDWETFLSDEMVAKDTPILQTWKMLMALLDAEHARILFITGRPEAQYKTTLAWLRDRTCEHRRYFAEYWHHCPTSHTPALYMRKNGDRRASHIVKEESLHKAIAGGFNPTLVFEDRKDDTAMWRRNGLLCCQVAEGNY